MAIYDFLHREINSTEYSIGFEDKVRKLALREMAMYIATSYITHSLAKCEIKTYENGKATKGELYYKLNVSPNPNESGAQFISHLAEELLYKGRALCVPVKNNLYVADNFAMETVATLNNVFSSISVEGQSVRRQRWFARDVFYFKLDNRAVSGMIRGMYDDYGALVDAAIKSYTAGSRERWVLELANTQAGDTKFAAEFENVIKKQLQTFLESDRAVYPQFKGQNLVRQQEQGNAPVSDIMTLQDKIFENVANAYHIPQAMMGGNINSIKDVFGIFLTVALDPVAEMIGDELTRKYYDYEEWQAGNYIKVDTSCVCHTDMFQIAADADKLISSGVACADEVRGAMGLDPLDTEFSTTHFITKNYTPVDIALTTTNE